MKQKHQLLVLFLKTLYISAFTFGGGFVIVTFMKKCFVDELHWIDENEMLDLIAIAQSSPGAIAVNGAIVVGYKLAGMPGIFCAILGAILPPFVIITAISAFYTAFKENFFIQNMLSGMRAGVGAVIISVVYDMGRGVAKLRSPILIMIMIAAFLANYYFKINVILIILLTALIGAIRTVVSAKKEAASDSKRTGYGPDTARVWF